MRQPLLARCACGNRKVERPLCQGGPGARGWWTKRWPMPGGCPVQVVDRGEGGWRTGVHPTLLECTLVLWEAFQLLFCVLASFNHSLMVVPPDRGSAHCHTYTCRNRAGSLPPRPSQKQLFARDALLK